MKISLEDLPPKAQFYYMAITNTAIYFKEMGYDKDMFLKSLL